MWKYLSFKQNDVDPSPEARAIIGSTVDFIFKFAGNALVTGVFGYLAAITGNWAVIAIAVLMSALLAGQLLTLIAGMQYFLWREAKSRPLAVFLWLIDAIIFLAICFTIYTAFFAILEVMRTGVGI
jgi:hypothetical protein